MAIPRTITVRFNAVMGGLTAPMAAAGRAATALGRDIGATTRRIDQYSREINSIQRRMATAPPDMRPALRAQRDALQDSRAQLQRHRAELQRGQEAQQRLGQSVAVAGVAMAAGFGMAVMAAAEFDKSMSKVAAVSNVTAKELGALRKAAIEAGRDTQYSARQAADAEAELAKAGIGTADILGGALKGSLALAAAGQLELADAATVSAQAMNIFNLGGAQVTHVADVLAAGANKSAADVKGLAWSLRMGGQVAAQTGLTLEDTIGTLSAFADQALIGSDAGTSLKVMLQHLANPSGKTAELMSDLGIEVYDTAGEFIGMAGVADVLQKQLGSLTQEQRDQAMAQIFGSDAVRGANVLYKIGAQGIREYTAAVNDNGAAAKTAAKLMDNLSGDLEMLKGSLETALITSGSGANNVLRDMVQVVTGAVNAYSALPESVQSGTVMIIGFAGAAIIVSRGVMFMVSTIRDARVALMGMNLAGASVGPTMMAIRTALMSTATFLTGPWGVAILAGIGLWKVWNSTKKEAAQASVEFTAAIQQDSGALGENTRAAVVSKLSQEELKSTHESVLKIAERVGVSLPKLTDAVLGNKEAYDQVKQSIENYAQSLEAKAASGEISTEQLAKELEGLTFLNNVLDDQSGTLKASAEESRRKTEATKDDTVATKELTTATEHVTEAIQDHETAEQALVATMKSSATTAKDLQQAFDNLAQANMSVDEANIKARQSTEESMKVTDKKAGLNDKEAQSLIDLARNYQNVLVAEKATGTYGDELFKIQDKLRAEFIKSALAKGADGKLARQLAADYGLLVDRTLQSAESVADWIGNANAAATAAKRLAMRTGGDAKSAQDAFNTSIRNMLPVLYSMTRGDKALTSQVDALAKATGNATGRTRVSKEAFMAAAHSMRLGTGEANKLWKALSKIKSRNIGIAVNAKGEWEVGGAPKSRRSSFATGGAVPNVPGGSRAYDSVPAILRVDEHVWTPEEVDAAGGHSAMYRMRGLAKAGKLKGYAAGGRVGYGNLTKPGGYYPPYAAIDGGYQTMMTNVAGMLADSIKRAMSGGGVVAAARSMIGYPYSWGGGGSGGPSYGIGRGAGTYGFDCSGLTEYAWHKGRGLGIGGTTYEQHPNSHSIGTPRAGALGFPHLGHVVIASGSGTIIQAPYTGSYVQEVPISRSYDWRWPNGAGFAKGGKVTSRERDVGQRFVAGTLADRERARAAGIAGDAGPVKRYANGGWVYGRSPVPILAENNEFVVRAGAARRNAPLLEAINSGRGGSSGGGSITLINQGVIGSQRELRKWFKTTMEDVRRRGELPR